VGAEVESYVRSAYAGGLGLLYRCEPVAIAFSDDYTPVVPLASRPPGGTPERTQLLRLQLTARPEVALGPEPTAFTAVGTDWLTAHRSVVSPPADTPWRSTASAAMARGVKLRSADPMAQRLAGLTQRPGVTCGLTDPLDTTGSLLVAPPQGAPDPLDASAELWPERARLRAVVRPYASGHVERQQFVAGDETAFTTALDDGPGPPGDWSVDGGELAVTGTAIRRYAIFGDDDWDHLTIIVTAHPDAEAFGLGIGLPAGSTPSAGLFAVVERAGAGRQLVIYSRTDAGGLNVVKQEPLPPPSDAAAPISLAVTGYDDQLQAQVGDTRIRVDRVGQGTGRCCLLATGPARFSALSVHGLDVYAFPVRVSRFRSFEDHVRSFDGTVASLGPDALGGGTTTSTVAALWSATRTAVAAAMAPGADAGARQALFDRWIRALGLPLRVDLARLSVGAVRDPSGAAVALLLESPEPLDFTTEITATLSRRVRVWKPPGVPGGQTEISIAQRLHNLDGSPTDLSMTAAPVPARPTATTVDGRLGQWTYRQEPIPVEVVQDRQGLRALLLPLAAADPAALAAGDFLLGLALTRVRFETSEPADSVNCYVVTTDVSFTI
jgi:hypothetical protein